MSHDSELEHQLRAFGETLQHEVGEPITPSTAVLTAPSSGVLVGGDQRRVSGGARRWPVVAAAALIVVGVVVVAMVRVADAPEPATVTQPAAPTTTPQPESTAVIEIEHRVLIDGEPVGDPWTTGLARNPDEFVELWEGLGLSETLPGVDFDDSVVILFGPAESGSCRFGPLGSVTYDSSTGRVFPVLPLEDPGADGTERACTGDENPHAILVEVARAALPSTEFVVWVSNLDPPACCGANVTRVAAGELFASAQPDPSSLRYPQPLPDDAVAFVNDLSLPAPAVFEPEGVPGPQPQPGQRQAGFVLLDGADVSARGIIAEIQRAWDPSEYTGVAVDIGIGGAVFVDDEEGAIAYPVDGAVRLVGSDAFFRFGSADPAVTGTELANVARAVGASDDWATAELENRGIYVFDETGDEWPASGFAPRVFVEHGPNGRVVLYRFDRPLSEQRFIAFVAHTLRPTGAELPDDLELGDTAIVHRHAYIELLSPVDVVAVTSPQPSIEMLLDVASADALDAAFDGTVDAPPRPAR